MSTSQANASQSSITSLAMAIKTLVPHSCGFRWSNTRKNIFDCGQLAFKMARSMPNDYYTTPTATIQHLRMIFSRFGLPETLVSDNGPQFAAEEFRSFC